MPENPSNRLKRRRRIPRHAGERWPERLSVPMPAVLLARVRLAARAEGKGLGEWSRTALGEAAALTLARLGWRSVMRPGSPVYRGGAEVLRTLGGERVLVLGRPDGEPLPAGVREGEEVTGRALVVDLVPEGMGGIPWCRSVLVHVEDVVPVEPVRIEPAGPADPSGFGVL